MGNLVRLGSVLALAVAMVAPAAAQAEAACAWGIEELPLPSRNEFYFYDVKGGSDNGEWVLGDGYDLATGGGITILAWRDGVLQPERYGGYTVSDVNNSGVMAGGERGDAYRVVNGVREALGKVRGVGAAAAQHINNAGDVLGISGPTFSDRGPLVVWPAGSTTPTMLPGTDDGVVRVPAGIDDGGNVIAQEERPDGQTWGRVWDRAGRATRLDTLPAHDSAVPQIISNGRIFGWSSSRFDGRNVVQWGLDGKIVRVLTELDFARDANASGRVLGRTWIRQDVGVVNAPGEVELLPRLSYGVVLADNGDVYGTYDGPGSNNATPLHARCG
ncbi:hypothetical protein [Lentzea sp. NBRC 102530]|uniref:hypothetical protein n=1 Tax=Lentzea sp. NBRC 102530 TaxID=3032201 RepID=UPI0024A2C8D7|nr:hypothetical protein [Lentzea sp. NBRC 102530]GLY49415.1 hypothetical protein Lesp01_30710 [Lentzea sp. NBRC 102530]